MRNTFLGGEKCDVGRDGETGVGEGEKEWGQFKKYKNRNEDSIQILNFILLFEMYTIYKTAYHWTLKPAFRFVTWPYEVC